MCENIVEAKEMLLALYLIIFIVSSLSYSRELFRGTLAEKQSRFPPNFIVSNA